MKTIKLIFVAFVWLSFGVVGPIIIMLAWSPMYFLYLLIDEVQEHAIDLYEWWTMKIKRFCENV